MSFLVSSTDPLDRLAATHVLDEPVTRVRFCDGNRAKELERLGICRVRDLVTHYPHRYNDMTQVVSIASAPLGEKVSVVGVVDQVKVKRPKRRLSVVEISLVDDTGVLIATWFNQPWVAKNLRTGMKVLFFGKVGFDYGFRRMDNPRYTILAEEGDEGSGEGTGVGSQDRILPVHRATTKLSPQWMQRLVREALQVTSGVLDPLPLELRQRYHLMDRERAWKALHFPRSMEERAQARRRLAYEEMLGLQIRLVQARIRRSREGSATVHDIHGPGLSRLRETLPFQLTAGQAQAVEDILKDMAAPEPMNRLLLGDVGSGKTIVAAHALVAAADTGTQAVMMAPTEVLAQQYGEKLGPLLDSLGITWALLTSATGKGQRDQILTNLEQGLLQVLFGTHAVLEEDVVFSDLSLVVIDEQHRFGVDQRQRLSGKRPGCDLLSMTATPIPRSLALTLYGDMECSYIRERPSQRAQTTTRILPRRKRGEAYDAIRAAVEAGHQAYIICPIIDAPDEEAGDSGDGSAETGEDVQLLTEFADPTLFEDIHAAEREYQILSTQAFPQYRVALLTGRMSTQEKREVMESFRAGRIDILVSTTVVEVGVDVPNATVMMVENAERFGLTQLHQLRGRVGRGSDPAQVFLIAQPTTEEGQARMEAMERTDDGFELAEYDLTLRREGDILGVRQHGYSPLKLVNVMSDGKLIACAHEDAVALLTDDPDLSHPEHALLAHDLDMVFGTAE